MEPTECTEIDLGIHIHIRAANPRSKKRDISDMSTKANGGGGAATNTHNHGDEIFNEAVEDERLVLGAIYGQDFTSGTGAWSKGHTFALKLLDAVHLHFTLPLAYPDLEAPKVAIKVLPNSALLLTDKHVAEMERELLSIARMRIGTPSCHELAQWAENYLRDVGQRQTTTSVDLYKAMMMRQKREDEALRLLRTAADTPGDAPDTVDAADIAEREAEEGGVHGPVMLVRSTSQSWADVAREAKADVRAVAGRSELTGPGVTGPGVTGPGVTGPGIVAVPSPNAGTAGAVAPPKGNPQWSWIHDFLSKKNAEEANEEERWDEEEEEEVEVEEEEGKEDEDDDEEGRGRHRKEEEEEETLAAPAFGVSVSRYAAEFQVISNIGQGSSGNVVKVCLAMLILACR